MQQPGGDLQTRVEQLLRDAHLARVRQRGAQAEALCRQALALLPEDPLGQEMLADLLAERGDLKEALDLYRRAFARAPQKASLEEKIARLVLIQEEEEQERIRAQLLLASPARKAQTRRQTTLALLLTLLCPGVGQILAGEYAKGAAILATWLVSAFGWGDLLKLAFSVSGSGPRGQEINGLLAVLGLLGPLVWIYALLDVIGSASRSRGGDL